MHHQQDGPSDRQPPYRLDHLGLGRSVQRRGRFVEEQDGPVREEGPGEGEPLPLPCGQPGPVLTEHTPDAPGQRVHEVQGARVDQRPSYGGVVGVGAGEADILGDRPGVQLRPLRHPGDSGPPAFQVHVGEIDSPTLTRPSAGRTNPNRAFSNVDLPDPLGPTRATVSRGPQ